MTKKFVFFICVFLGIFIVSYIFIDFNNAKKQEFQLNNVPSEILTGKNKDSYFLYDNGDLFSVKLIDEKIKFAKKFENISQASFEKNCVALVDKQNRFSFVGTDELCKKVFSDKVNSKSKKILKITSGNNFTNVLFEDGEVYSDINYTNKNNEIDEKSFLVLNNIKDIASSQYQLSALNTENYIHIIACMPNNQIYETLTSKIDDAVSVYAGEREIYIHTQNEKILFLKNEQIYNEEEQKAEMYQSLTDIKKMTIGVNNVMLAYSRSGALYHWGNGYIYKKRVKSIPEIIIPEICHKDENIRLFKGTHQGIFVVTDNGMVRIIKN
ncbi:MAG: hypothetical protein IKA17_11260 [Clostridia bacterium]|nr:hypothetical protein [Clostridia bacterium]